MRFSVIVSSYNQLATLGKTFDGLLSQTFRDFDVHLCDDGSDYDVSIYLRKIKKYIKCYYHKQEHKGMRLARNLNQGIKRATGEYCVILTGDSYPRFDWIETLNRVVSEKVIACSFRDNVDTKGEHVSYDWRFNGVPPWDLEEIVFPTHPDQPWVSMTGNGMVAPTKFYKEIGGWPEKYEGYGRDDWDVILQAKKKGFTFFTVPAAIIYHTQHKEKPENPQSIEKFERSLSE